MLEPRDRVELLKIRDARRRHREISRWETLVARRAVANGALHREVAGVLGVSEMMVSKIVRRDLADQEGDEGE